jgi:hypothetical protein
LNANYEPKAPFSTPYKLEGNKWMNNQPRSSTPIPHIQTNHQVPLIPFDLSMNMFNITWSLGFGQVHILDLPLL